jgi:hypothetical protein
MTGEQGAIENSSSSSGRMATPASWCRLKPVIPPLIALYHMAVSPNSTLEEPEP